MPNTRPSWRLATSAAVLAGGASQRLGFPKALLRLGSGRTLIQQTVALLAELTDDLLVVANDPVFEVFGARRVPDRHPGAAALGGIYTAIAEAAAERVVVVGCDMPLLSVPLLRHLFAASDGHDLVVPRIGGFPEPLHAVYTRACAAPIARRIAAGQLRVVGFFDEVRVRYVDEPELRAVDPELDSFRNVNTPDALRELWQPGKESNLRRHP